MADATKKTKAEPAAKIGAAASPKSSAGESSTAGESAAKTADAKIADAKTADSKTADAKTSDGKTPDATKTESGAPANYSRGEGQKPVTAAYKENWNAIFGNKKNNKKR
jgi:hypothetical protein